MYCSDSYHYTTRNWLKQSIPALFYAQPPLAVGDLQLRHYNALKGDFDALTKCHNALMSDYDQYLMKEHDALTKDDNAMMSNS
jgi:hypothetical protein